MGELDQDILRALENVRATVEDSNDRMAANEQMQADLNTRAEAWMADTREKVLTKEHFKKRRRQAIAIAVIVSFFTIAIEHYSITRCFLSPSQTGWSNTTCSAIFPGYTKARKVSAERTAQFNAVLSSVPENRQRILQLESQVKELQAKDASR